MFTICLFISPELDGHRAPKMRSHRDDVPFCICIPYPSNEAQNLVAPGK